MHSGWIEKRQFERVDAMIKVSYCVLPKEELVVVLAETSYRDSTAEMLPNLSKRSATLNAVTKDISIGGMSLVGEEAFPAEGALEIKLHLPTYPIPLTMLAEVVRLEAESSGALGTMYRAGIKILAINRGDVMHLDKFLLAEKIRQRGMGKNA